MSGNKQNMTYEDEKQLILEETGVIDFKNRLQLVLENLSGNAFAKKVGMSEAVIRDYLSGKTYPSLNRLAIIAKKCDVPIEWLATGTGNCRLLVNNGHEGIVHIQSYNTSLNKEHEDKSKITGAPPMETLPFNLGWIKYRSFDPDDLAIFWAKGDSMAPTVSNLDALIMNRSAVIPTDGYIYVVRYGDALSVKRIQNHGKHLLLLCDNKKYPEIKVEKQSDEDFEIIGHVVYILKDLN